MSASLPDVSLRESMRAVLNDRSRPTLFHARAMGLALAISLGLWSATARADLWGADVGVLSSLLAQEIKEGLDVAAELAELEELVRQTREYVGIAKATYQGIDELRHLSWRELRKRIRSGVVDAFPEVGEIYADIKDISDLRHADPRSVETLRGMLWEHVYGPAIERVHSAHENAEALAKSKDQRLRQSGILGGMRHELDTLAKDCDKGAGACTQAAARAQIKSAQILTDLHETELNGLALLERQRETDDAGRSALVATAMQFTNDFRAQMRGEYRRHGVTPCRAGSCLYDAYGSKRGEVISDLEALHPGSSSYGY